MYDADRPILNSAQDRLNRALFAKYLARSMLDHEDPESLVIGLFGESGVGKTSIINLVIEELNFAGTNLEDPIKPILLNFSPWSYSGQNQIIYNFFRRLSAILRNVEALENADRIIYLLELYVSFFTQQPVPKSLRRKRTAWQILQGQAPDDRYGWESGRDLTLVKAELNEFLRQQKHKIIIMIDNISRLSPIEIKQIFQIVKSMGDYFNTIYLLAFDKPQVVHAINQLDGSGGQALVDKIVQLPFSIPPIMHQDLENIFADRLNPLIAHSVPEETWDTDYWADIYYNSLKYFFMHCRDITRYVNTLNFSYPRLRDVVNPVDFFALTAIEVFVPDIYFGIRDNKDLFTDLFDQVYELDEEKTAREKHRCDEIIKRSQLIPNEIILELLLHLFPRLRKIYQPTLIFYHAEAAARKLRRICSPDLFDAYFRLSMQRGKFSEAEFETILTLASDYEAFDQALSRLNQDDRIILFLDRFDNNVLTQIPMEQIESIIIGLLDNGDLFPFGIGGPINLETPLRIHRIVHGLLRRVPQQATRFQILQNAIAQSTKSLYSFVYELTEQSREHLTESDTFIPLSFRDLTPEQLTSLKKLIASRIESWASNNRLSGHPKLLALLSAWRDWGDENTCRRYVKQLTDTDRGLVAFLQATLEQPINDAITAYIKRPTWSDGLDTIEGFIPAHLLEEHAKTLFENPYFEKLREKEQLALMIFLDLMHTATTKVIPDSSA